MEHEYFYFKKSHYERYTEMALNYHLQYKSGISAKSYDTCVLLILQTLSLVIT